MIRRRGEVNSSLRGGAKEPAPVAQLTNVLGRRRWWDSCRLCFCLVKIRNVVVVVVVVVGSSGGGGGGVALLRRRVSWLRLDAVTARGAVGGGLGGR